MTREEIINEIKCLLSELNNGEDAVSYLTQNDVKWLNENIKALKQEPTTKNDLEVDLIDRAELLKAMDTWDKFGFEHTGCFVREPKDDFIVYVHYDDMVKCVKGMPPVTPIRPKGHWISHREHCENLGVMPSGLGAYEWCSNCDCGIDVREWHRNNYNYCPNCGADMREVEE